MMKHLEIKKTGQTYQGDYSPNEEQLLDEFRNSPFAEVMRQINAAILNYETKED